VVFSDLTMGTTTSANVTTCNRMIEAWGTGAFSGDKKNETTKQFYWDDVVVDATMNATNTDMYTTYKGHAGVLKWTERLTELEFPDFTILSTVATSHDTVLAKFSSTPVVKATGKVAPFKVSDILEMTVVNGKVRKMKFYWGYPAEVDALFKK